MGHFLQYKGSPLQSDRVAEYPHISPQEETPDQNQPSLYQGFPHRNTAHFPTGAPCGRQAGPLQSISARISAWGRKVRTSLWEARTHGLNSILHLLWDPASPFPQVSLWVPFYGVVQLFWGVALVAQLKQRDPPAFSCTPVFWFEIRT